MKKLFIPLLICSLILNCSISVNAQMDYEKVSTKALESSVLIHIKAKIKDGESKGRIIKGGCSGTFISKDEVLSAAHCFESYDPVNIWVRDINGKSYVAEIIKLDVAHDLSLLHIKGLKTHTYSKLGKNLKVGEEIINIGSPFNIEFLVSHGIVSSIHVEIAEFKSLYTITDAAINPGSSGGGVFNKNSELVGVNTMTEGSPFGWSGISLAVSIEDVHNFLGK